MELQRLVDLAIGLLEPPDRSEPVIRHASPDEIRTAIGAELPLELDGTAASIDELAAALEVVVEHSMRTSHPRFINQNFAGADPVAVVGDWIGAALHTTAATYEMAPVFTLMERELVLRLGELAGFPEVDGLAPGMFCAGGSIGALHALQLARHRHDPAGKQNGYPQRFAVFTSATAHYSTAKATSLLGMGTEAAIEVAVDASGAMDIDALNDAVATALADGRTPLAVVATAGTTVTASFDPIDALADVCAAHDMWLHVDGCFGGSALFSQRQRHRLAGSERADSMVWNLHKMTGITQQCTALLVRRPVALRECFASGADYLFQPDKLHADMDLGDATFVCARRVDTLKLWITWKLRGDAGFAARVDHAVGLADRARELIADADDLELVGPGDFSTVCLRWVPPAGVDQATADRIPTAAKALMQREGTAMIGVQPVGGVNCFRLIFTNPEMTAGDVDDLLEIIRDTSRRAASEL